jgi:hypothetical protein
MKSSTTFSTRHPRPLASESSHEVHRPTLVRLCDGGGSSVRIAAALRLRFTPARSVLRTGRLETRARGSRRALAEGENVDP